MRIHVAGSGIFVHRLAVTAESCRRWRPRFEVTSLRNLLRSVIERAAEGLGAPKGKPGQLSQFGIDRAWVRSGSRQVSAALSCRPALLEVFGRFAKRRRSCCNSRAWQQANLQTGHAPGPSGLVT